ncbi:FHA modulated ABC efflux pump with fused ATPase and integral membrane subunits [Desulfobulbus propionicus DSM 2032]|uniref:FHA modulated ABC efflux pump with fused ATPase and integral membrane subunits n=1 Tax=Desulfobulbus propionicus (strain ATCC 33891 / DSM 2032 / VKM B-1956 / 1pr3) TaxID=577650 RepID=A0A7U3YJM9_DESPD|nr:FHA modulated ABC efflux pump with fused ATPase and integral membrane subunits [Desulfobulbus propionicus DSM 2032]
MASSRHHSSPSEHTAYLAARAAGCAHREYCLTSASTTIGRDGTLCDIVLTGATVSRRHACLSRTGETDYQLHDLQSTNGVFVNGERIKGSRFLRDGDLIGLGTALPHLRFQYHSIREPHHLILPPQAQWLIGRAPHCDLSLPFEPTVSSHHATLSSQDGTLRIADAHSLNGTWVNGSNRFKAFLAPDDTVVIGSTHFQFRLREDGSLSVLQREYGQSVKLECVGLHRTAPRANGTARMLLNDITLSIEPGEFVGILGPSGAGKTTLLTALNGFSRPDRGWVLCNETPMDSASALFRNTIGYVPQDDILHRELSVQASLEYVARLRLSPDLSPRQRAEIIDNTIETLGLHPVRHLPIDQLSGGQRKRVSIGAELLVRPSLLFLDEPTSGLDPSTEDRLMHHFRDMADHGTTVIITTHLLDNLDLLDKVVILAQGRVVFFGAPSEALTFFGTEQQPLARATGIFAVLTEADTPSSAAASSWKGQEEIATHHAARFLASPWFRQHIEQRLSPAAHACMAMDTASPSRPLARLRTLWADRSRRGHGFSPGEWLRSWCILSRRHLHIRASAGKRLLLFLLIPMALALVTLSQHIPGVASDAVVAERRAEIEALVAPGGALMDTQLKLLLSPAGIGETRSGAELLHALRYEGIAHLPVPMSVLLMIVMTAVFSGTLIACQEISTERSIYLRERMSHLRILPYLGAKMPFCLGLAALQCLIFLSLCWLNPALRQADFFPVWLTMVAVAWSSVAIGLTLSAVDPTGGRLSVMLTVAVVLPQLLLSGGLGPDFYGRMHGPLRLAADLLPARWGLEMVCTALFDTLKGEGARWIPAFVREVIGFDFGQGVYYSGMIFLLAQFLLWVLFCTGFLTYRDRRSC